MSSSDLVTCSLQGLFAAIGAYNAKQVARDEENFLRMKRWNAYDSFYTFLTVAGLASLAASLFFIRSEMVDDGYALALFSLTFLFAGSLNAIARVKALYRMHASGFED